MSQNFLKKLSERTYEDAIAFHGHSCGGLALGYVAALYARELLALTYSEDEEIVVRAETDSCTVDAIQTVLGTTAGKGNLVIHNWGKTAFSFYNRADGRSIRLIMKNNFLKADPETDALRQKVMAETATAEEAARYRQLSEARVAAILAMAGSDVYDVKETQLPLPEKAKIFENIMCPICGESVGIARCVESGDRKICAFCAQL